MRSVVWTEAAKADYFAILQHIAQDDPDAADRVIDKIIATGESLAHFATGHPGRVSGTYEKTVRGLPYVLAYALTDRDTAITVLRVIHAARDWRDGDWPGDGT